MYKLARETYYNILLDYFKPDRDSVGAGSEFTPSDETRELLRLTRRSDNGTVGSLPTLEIDHVLSWHDEEDEQLHHYQTDKLVYKQRVYLYTGVEIGRAELHPHARVWLYKNIKLDTKQRLAYSMIVNILSDLEVRLRYE